MTATGPADPATLDALVEAARAAAANSYSPYSRFRVGAAMIGDSGRIHAGTNVENASYGLAICAERSAIVQAIAAGERRIRAIVVYTPTGQAVSPCGACRQFICEFADDHTEVYAATDAGIRRRWTAAQLLPDRFSL